MRPGRFQPLRGASRATGLPPAGGCSGVESQVESLLSFVHNPAALRALGFLGADAGLTPDQADRTVVIRTLLAL